MIELRPRKLARLHLSVSGSAGGDAPEEGTRAGSSQQVPVEVPAQTALVKKRGRKPKITLPVQCKEENGAAEIASGGRHDKGAKGRGRPRLVRAPCVPPASEGLCQQRKRGRKPKQSECQITRSEQSCASAVPKEISNGRITSVGLGRLAEAGSAQDSVVSGQGKRRGRKPKVQQSIKCEDLETGDTLCVNYGDAGGGSKNRVSVGSNGERKKRGRKAGSLLWKVVKGIKDESPGEELKGLSSAEKNQIRISHVRVKRTLLGQLPKKTVGSSENLKSDVKEPHPEPPRGEERNSSTELTCLKTLPRNSRRLKRVNPISSVKKRKTLVISEQNANCRMTASEPYSMLEDEEKTVKSETSESTMTKCSNNTCHVHCSTLPNPVVRLQNCKCFQNSTKKPVRLTSMLSPLNVHSQISLIDSTASDHADISAIENLNHSGNVVKSTSFVKNKNHNKTFLKVKLNFRKTQQESSHSKESDTELNSIDSGVKDLKSEAHQEAGDCIAKPKSSRSCNETLMDKLNNNSLISDRLNSTNDQNKVGTSPICSPWIIWRSQAPFVSDEEISDHDFDKSSSIIVHSSYFSKAKEELGVICQRVIPFTGKTIWKCSCARTYVSAIPRKRPADVQNTVILGIEAERSLEIYSDDKHLLLDNIGGESIQERTKDNASDALCKKRKLDLHIESTSPYNLASRESTLGDSPSSITSDTSPSLPLAPETSIKNSGVEYSEHCELGKAPIDKRLLQSQGEDKTRLCSKPPSKTVTEIDKKTIANQVPFKIPNDETLALLHGALPVVCSICPTSTELEEVDNSLLKDDPKSSCNHSDSEDEKSNSCPSDCIDKGDSVAHEEGVDQIKPVSTEKSANNYTIDLLKAYEEDILVIDVIQDDPELFNFSIEEERSSSEKRCNTKSVIGSKPKKIPSISEVQKKVVSPAVESKPCIKRIEYVPESSSDLIHDFFDDHKDACDSLPETNKMRPYAEMEESRGPTDAQDKDSPRELHHADMLDESESSPPFREVLPSKPLPLLRQPFFHHQKTESSIANNNLPPWMHDCPSIRKNVSPPEVVASDIREKWKPDKAITQIKKSWLPPGYCRYFFNTFKGCTYPCSYLHIPKNCDEKVCMDVLHKLISENSTFLLKRAVWIFTNYYSQYPPRLHYDRGIFGALLNPLLNLRLWQDVFHLLETVATAKICPSFDQIIKIFESVAFSGLQTAFSRLLDIFCKFVHNGMNITPVEINHIIAIMSKSSAANNHISILLSMKSSLELKISKTNWTCDMDAVVSEVEHCKVNSDWMKLGTLYLTVCTGCENLTNIKTFSRCIAEALMKDAINERPEIPYCEFASAIFKNPQFNEIQKNLLGRIGISVMFFYHHKEMWLKGRKVIHKFHELKINYTILKGLLGQESTVSRCHVVNIAVEIFLKCGNLGSAVQTLKESDWIINTSMWPCNMMDVLHRHNLMCLLVCEALSKSMFTLCFEVLQNLPGFQESQTDVNVSQYAMLFNKVLNTCVVNRSIGISASIIDFMIVKKIAIDYLNLQVLITTLGRSGLWTKAREYYKSAKALGFYPLFEGKTNPNILYIPSFMSEVEMLMTIEQFMVLNASSIQLQGGCNQSPQIVLKRMEQDNAKSKDSYHASAERLFEASRLSNPRLFIKHLTVNNMNEEVYTLDSNSALKWLNENMKWASSVWYFH